MTAHVLPTSPAACLLLALASAMSAPLAADEKPEQLTIATWNLEWFFDEHTGDNYGELPKKQSAPSFAHWQWKRDSVAGAIARIRPDIVALQEVENSRVLWYLVQRLKANHGLTYRIAFVEGGDYYTEQDVALLYRSGLVELGRWEGTSEHRDDPSLAGVSKHQFAKFQWGDGSEQERLVIVNLHLRAAADKAAVRRRQARQLCRWLQRLDAEEHAQLVILGDFNTQARFDERGTSELSILQTLDGAPGFGRLTDVHRFLQPAERPTHLGGGQLDRILLGTGLMQDEPDRTDLVFRSARGARELVIRGRPDRSHWDNYYEIPPSERDLSDHYPVVAEFDFK